MSAPAVETIRFYRTKETPYGVFSNLSRREIQFEGRTFRSSEDAYQFGKPNRVEVAEWLIAAPTPALCALAAHALPTWDVRSDWAMIKLDRMRRVLDAKFRQHPDLAKILLGTGDAILIESGTVNNAVNRFWGEVNGKGQNWLGNLLMQVRHELRDA